jgi:hypothetical protein
VDLFRHYYGKNVSNYVMLIMSRSGDHSSMIKWAGHVARVARRKRNACKILMGKPEVKRLLGRPRRRCGYF